MAIASDVSRAGHFCYIMHAVPPQVRSLSSLLRLASLSPLSLFSPEDPRFPPEPSSNVLTAGCIDATHRQRGQTRLLEAAGLCFVREDYHYCGVTMRARTRILGYINSAEADVPREDESRVHP